MSEAAVVGRVTAARRDGERVVGTILLNSGESCEVVVATRWLNSREFYTDGALDQIAREVVGEPVHDGMMFTPAVRDSSRPYRSLSIEPVS